MSSYWKIQARQIMLLDVVLDIRIFISHFYHFQTEIRWSGVVEVLMTYLF